MNIKSEEIFDSSLDLLRRLDPKNISKNLNNICKLQPELSEDLLSSIDTPLPISRCLKTGKNFLCCDYNRDGDSYRSPWSNTYLPAISDEDDDIPYPSEHLRELEIYANESFDIYRDLYYVGGISSVYLWDTEDEPVDSTGTIGFSGVALFKKSSNTATNTGSWDSIHVFEVEPKSNGLADYKITSTILLDLSNNKDTGDLDIYLSGNLIRQNLKTLKFNNNSSAHISNLGSIIEEIESNLRNSLKEIYFNKTKDILGDVRSIEKITFKNDEKVKHEELIKNMQTL